MVTDREPTGLSRDERGQIDRTSCYRFAVIGPFDFASSEIHSALVDKKNIRGKLRFEHIVPSSAIRLSGMLHGIGPYIRDFHHVLQYFNRPLQIVSLSH